MINIIFYELITHQHKNCTPSLHQMSFQFFQYGLFFLCLGMFFFVRILMFTYIFLYKRYDCSIKPMYTK